MKKLLIIAVLCLTSSVSVDAQLLEDTDRKLKNAKVERKSFLFFGGKKKLKRSSGIPSSGRSASPRFSSVSSPFKSSRGVSPRYSSAQDKSVRYAPGVRTATGKTRFKSFATSPRFSSGNPFRGNTYRPTPRFSAGNPFRNNQYRVAPRYSQGHRYAGSKSVVSPRYSPSSPFRGQSYKVTPRYSVGNPFKGYRFNVSPRYSSGSPFKARDHKVSVRYSFTSTSFRKSRFAHHHSPVRYSTTSSSFKNSRFAYHHSRVRYSKGMPFRGNDYKINPRFTGTKINLFKNRDETAMAKYHQQTSLWEGDSESVRLQFLLRQWDRFWARLNGNLSKTRGVKQSGEKSKFDKKERVIWNN